MCSGLTKGVCNRLAKYTPHLTYNYIGTQTYYFIKI